jgi:hypothetical protein
MNLAHFLPRRLVAAVVIATASTAAFAQAPASPPAAPEPPKPACTKQSEFPGNLASDRMKRGWIAEVNAYIACLKKFAEEQGALAQAHAKAAGAAIDEYNATVKMANEVIK